MFKPYSAINSKRTCQDALNILRQGSVRENVRAHSVSSSLGSSSFSSSLGSSSADSSANSDPFDIGPQNSDDRWTGPPSVNQRKPGLRLGLKRVVMKTLGDEPPNKKERVSVALPKDTRCFCVLFAKPQTKKHKTWENDGYLLVKNSSLTLKNHQGVVVTCGRLVNQVLEDGNHFPVGDKIVQIQEELFELPAAVS